jgi:O-antigen/teichoic acid export membrane protein
MIPGIAQLRRWAPLLFQFFSLQVITQLTVTLAGFIVVRSLPVPEFALYTLVTALQAALTVLSDTGVSTILMAKGGQVHGDRGRLAALVASAHFMRRRLELIAIGLSAPLLWIWLGGKGLTVWNLVAIVIVVAIGLHFQIAASVFNSVPLVLLQVRSVQLAQLVGALVRIALVGLAVVIRPTYFAALCANTVGMAVQAWMSRWYAAREIDLRTPPHPGDLSQIRTLVFSQVINSVYYAFSSQITIWVIGLVGTRRLLAEVGALGRLGSIITLAQPAIAMLLVPRLARIGQLHVFIKRYALIVALTFWVGVLAVAFSLLFPGPILALLGQNYSTLNRELPLAIAASATYLFSATIFTMNSSKAWIEGAWVAVPMVIGLQIASAFWFDLATVRGVILFGWVSSLPPILVNTAIAITRAVRWRAREVGAL